MILNMPPPCRYYVLLMTPLCLTLPMTYLTYFSTMNIELEAINQWFRANKLCLNVNKTKNIVFRPTATHIQTENINIKINNEPVERIGNTMNSKSFKFLGIHMDENINWKAHINYICNKISRSNYIINKAIRDGRPRPRATRWVGTFPYILTPIPNLYDHSFPRYGQITFLTFQRPTTLTFDLKF